MKHKTPRAMTKTLLLLMLFNLGCVFQTAAQHKIVVYGNLGVENVNISVGNTQYGTSTNPQGQYELPLYDRTRAVRLHYSCIGYQDTVVSLSPRQLQHDSINISFSMRKLDYPLQEVTVTAKQKLYGERYFFMDFETFDQTMCILAACPNKKQFCLIMVDDDLHGVDTIPIPLHIKPKQVLRDCMGNCQLITNDSIYEINLINKPHKFISVEKSYYFRTMSDCLFTTDEHIYFKEKAIEGYLTSFYRINRTNLSCQVICSSDMTNNLVDLMDELRFNARCPSGTPLGIYIRYLQEFWFRPSDAELQLADNNLYFFEHSQGYILRYNLDLNQTDSCAIQYPSKEGWKHTLYQDQAQNKFYTIVKDQLFEIDPLSGCISAKTKLGFSLYSKIIIQNDQLFLLKKIHGSSGETRTIIERRKL